MNRRLIYRVAILIPDSRRVLVERRGRKMMLPRVSVRQGRRAVRQIQRAIWLRWGLSIVILDFFAGGDATLLCVAESLSPLTLADLKAVPISALYDVDVDARTRSAVQEIAMGVPGSRSRLSSVGWLNEAMAWIEVTLGHGANLSGKIEQYNAGGGFALLKVKTADRGSYWIKAVGQPNLREFPITKIVSAVCPDQLPVLVAVKDEWNAWLMQDAGKPRTAGMDRGSLCRTMSAAAQIQKTTSNHVDSLIEAGARDNRASVLRDTVRHHLPFLREAMQRQSTAAVTKIADGRIEELGAILEDACEAMANSRIPDTIVHNDLNVGNILFHRGRCKLIDWCEVCIGSPFLFFQNVLRLAEREAATISDVSEALREIYSECWRDVLTQEQMQIGFTVAPLLAIMSHLSAYSDFSSPIDRVDDDHLGLVRSLVRHLDREARNAKLCGILRG